MIAVCETEGCPEQGVPKGPLPTMAPGEDVLCGGGCGQPCEVREGDMPAPDPEPEPKQ